jgi:NhaP-type Na+/H+ or K+/H+ antiporter
VVAYLTLATFLMVFCLIAKRLSNSVLTPPMAFIGFGVLLAWFGMVPEEGSEAALHLVAELALIVLLFLDAAKIDPIALMKRHVWPVRMLAIGLPLGFLIGVAAGWLLLPGWPFAAVALVAAILVPTDAALGQSVISNPAVPERPRRALTVESGLNDGFALPLVLMMAAFAAPQGMAPDGGWIAFGLKQILLGPLVGVIAGCIGGFALLAAKRTDSTADTFEGIAALALAASAYLSATLVGGNGFISAFAAGLGFGAVVRGKCAFVYEFTEGEGQLLSWAAFFLIGAVLLPEAAAHLTWASFALILVSLFIVRPLAIWLSLVGTDAHHITRLFFGWFGPRGLATALFALLVVEQLDHEIGENILHLAINAVWISAVLHGVTAAFGAVRYGRWIKKVEDAAEMSPLKMTDDTKI